MNRRSRSLAQVAVLAVISIVAGLSAWAWQDAPAQKQTFGTWGVDLTSRDPRDQAGRRFLRVRQRRLSGADRDST